MTFENFFYVVLIPSRVEGTEAENKLEISFSEIYPVHTYKL